MKSLKNLGTLVAEMVGYMLGADFHSFQSMMISNPGVTANTTGRHQL